MKILVREIGYTPMARHTWEYAVVTDDWLPPMPVYSMGRARSKNDALTLGRMKLADLEERYAAMKWIEAPKQAK